MVRVRQLRVGNHDLGLLFSPVLTRYADNLLVTTRADVDNSYYRLATVRLA